MSKHVFMECILPLFLPAKSEWVRPHSCKNTRTQCAYTPISGSSPAMDGRSDRVLPSLSDISVHPPRIELSITGNTNVVKIAANVSITINVNLKGNKSGNGTDGSNSTHKRKRLTESDDSDGEDDSDAANGGGNTASTSTALALG